MVPTITQKQVRWLEDHLRVLKEDDDAEMTLEDMILELYFPVKRGIAKHGMDVHEIMKKLGWDPDDLRTLLKARTVICQFAKSMVKQGVPFGGIKIGGSMRYGWSEKHEFDQLVMKRKERLACEISTGLHYLEENDKLTDIGKRFLKEYDKQLEIAFDQEN